MTATKFFSLLATDYNAIVLITACITYSVTYIDCCVLE